MLWIAAPRRGGINPLTLAGLELYLRSDQVTGADASTVTTWPDLSGVGRTANLTGYTGATGPTLRTTGVNISPNGTQMVQFGAAVTNGLRTASATIANTNGFTLYAYYKQIALTNRLQLLMNSSSQGFEWPARGDTGGGYTEGALGWREHAAGGGIFSFTELATTGYHLSVLQFPMGAAPAGWQDGVALTTAEAAWVGSFNSNIHIGNDIGVGSAMDASLGALLIFSRTHNTATRLGVEQWLREFFEA